jgi:cytochrome c biogenesis protein CcmG/thiol:disulfide interchange protein DsbE
MAETMTSGMILRRRLVFLAPVALFGVLAGYFVWGLNPDRNPRDLPSVMIDQPVPEFALSPIEGMEGPGLSDADLRTGEVTLVNFFASWCVPCRLEHRYLLELAKDDKVHLYGVNYKNEPAEARAWLAELGNPYGRIGADATGRVGIDWGVYGLPETFIIDRTGRIRYRRVGQIDQVTLDREILPLLRELSK